MNIEEIKTAATAGDIDKIYQLIESESPSDSEREQLKAIAIQQIDTNPEVAVAITLGTDEEFGRKIYERLLLNNQVDALRVMSDGEIPGYDTPLEDVLLLIAEHSSAEVWDWVIEKSKDYNNYLEESVIRLFGEAGIIAADKNPTLHEKLKLDSWDWNLSDGSEKHGGIDIISAIYSRSDVFKKIIEAYQPHLPDSAVAAAENGRIDNLEVLAAEGYDFTDYPLDPDNGTLADIAAHKNQTATVDWLISKGVKRDF